MTQLPTSTRQRHWVCAQRLRARRLALGLTQREVAGRLPEGCGHITNRALSAMENGRGLDPGLLPEFAETLECTVTYLLGLTDDPHSWQPDRWRGQRSDRTAERHNGAGLPARPARGVLSPDLPPGFSAPALARRRDPNISPAGDTTTEPTASHHLEVRRDDTTVPELADRR